MIFTPIKTWGAIVLSTPLLIGCGSTLTVQIPAENTLPATPSTLTPTPTLAASSPSTPTSSTLSPGTYCFNGKAIQDAILIDSAFQLDVMDNSQVMGVAVDAVYPNPAADRWEYGVYHEVQGSLNGNNLMVNLTTRIRSDRSDSTEQWFLSPEGLIREETTYTPVSCEAIAEQYPAGWGQRATGMAPPPEPRASLPRDVRRFTPADIAPQDGALMASDTLPPWVIYTDTFPVQFEPGEDSAFLVNDLEREQGHSYELWARAGQILEVDFASVEGYFNLFAPTGVVMVRENPNTVAVELPVDGQYYISVVTNAPVDRYSLRVRIIDP